MTSIERNNRRHFLSILGSSIAGTFSFLALGKTSNAATEKGVFGSQFLEQGRVVDMPAGYYDPEQKVFIEVDSGRPLVAQRMTGIMTCSYERKCTNMFYPNNGPPTCVSYDTEQVRHPDGFRPGDQGGC